MNNYIELGNRVPSQFFTTSGKGESDAGSKGLPYETGSYDAALNDAGIQNANIVKYTSVMATGLERISREEGEKNIKWGQVVECIMAQANGKKGATITATVMVTEVKDKNGTHLGGFACEYSGNGAKKQVEEALLESIEGMIERRNYGTFKKKMEMYKDNTTTKGFIVHPGKIFVFETLKVKEEHGTVLTSLCFTRYKYPIIHSKTKLKVGRPTHGGGRRTRKRRRRR